MTREEAIQILADLIDSPFLHTWEKQNKALHMAIEALSAEAVQGEWIDYIGADLGIEGQWLRDDGKTVFVQCDQCDSTFVRNLMTHMNFCPNCEAEEGAEIAEEVFDEIAITKGEIDDRTDKHIRRNKSRGGDQTIQNI